MSNTLIIAEAGVNHNGDIGMAKQLIDVAADAGVDFVKFQTFKADKLVSRSAKKADYQSRNIGDEDDFQFEMLKQLELSHEDHLELISYCKEKNVKFFSTAFDADGLDYLNGLGLDRFKVPSGEITNYPYLKKLSTIGKPIILSTGMATLKEVEEAMAVITSDSLEKDDITILHCNTEYPTPMTDVNLKAMEHIRNEIGVEVGYSDHTLGIEVPVAAVALGATVIEKHFTLDRTLPGPDHLASLEPTELKAMVKAIRNIEMALRGTGIKAPSESELKNLTVARKSIHVNKDVSEGEILREDDLVALRPGGGISPMEWKKVIGAKAKYDMKAFQILNKTDIEG